MNNTCSYQLADRFGRVKETELHSIGKKNLQLFFVVPLSCEMMKTRNTRLKLRYCHLETSGIDLARRLRHAEDNGDEWRIEIAATGRRHRHAKLPVKVNQLKTA
jgi:hypothetical protein